METLIHADIFFLISSIGFTIVFILLIIAFVYLISILRSVKRISKQLEGDVQNISAEAKELVSDLRSSMVYKFIFGKKHLK